MARIAFPYDGFGDMVIPDENLLAVLAPRTATPPTGTDLDEVRRALAEPIASPGLKDMVKRGDSALLLIDDNTRNTPAARILPLVLEELAAGGVQIQDTAILIALGTHRHMTDAEVEAKVGAELAGIIRIFQHDAHDESGLAHIGVTEHGTDVWVNKLLLEFDHVIAVGHITPHRVAGFSGGAKMVQPGVSGVVTTGQTHWISALYDGAEIMGTIDNPVRREMNAVAKKAGLSFIVNVVLDREERIYRCVCGDPEKAHAAGCEASREIFGVPFPEYADIVVTDTFPADSELWQAAKGIYAGDLPLKRGGVLITVTPCPEGVAQGHPELTEIGYLPFSEVKEMVDRNEIEDLTMAAHIVHVGRIIRDKGRGIMVCPCIDDATSKKLGFFPAATPQQALDLAFSMTDPDATVIVLQNGGDLLPIHEPRRDAQ